MVYLRVASLVAGLLGLNFPGEPGPDNRRREVTTGAEPGSPEYRYAPEDRHVMAGFCFGVDVQTKSTYSRVARILQVRAAGSGLFSLRTGASPLPYLSPLEEES